MGIVQRGIMAGKSEDFVSTMLLSRTRWILTEGADSSNNTQWLPVAASLHVLRDLENLAGHLCRNTARVLCDLQTTEDVASCIGKGLALLERDARSQSVPVLADEGCVLEHDLLPVEHAGGLPRGERPLSAVDRGLELRIGALRDSCHQVVGGRVVQVDPLCRLRGHKLVVEEVRCVLRRRDLLVGHRVVLRSSNARRLQVLRGGMQPPDSDLVGAHWGRHSGAERCCAVEGRASGERRYACDSTTGCHVSAKPTEGGRQRG